MHQHKVNEAKQAFARALTQLMYPEKPCRNARQVFFSFFTRRFLMKIRRTKHRYSIRDLKLEEETREILKIYVLSNTNVNLFQGKPGSFSTKVSRFSRC
jgi:hypothetical protein